MTEPASPGEPDAAFTSSERIPYWRMVIDQAGITAEVANYKYAGSGTADDPYLVRWIPNDPRNPMLLSEGQKWFITIVVAFSTLAVALVSSAYTGGMAEIIEHFHISQEVATLGVSLFVLGFAVGPLIWAPLSEVFGRQVLFIVTYAGLTAFNAGCAGAQNSWTLIILRFFAGAFGSSPLTNAGGIIADMFPASQRGLALTLFAAAPSLGPVLGPVIGGFMGMNAGWRWVMGFLAAFAGAVWILETALVPETYAPVILRQRAKKLSEATGKVYISHVDHDQGKVTMREAIGAALWRPWVLLVKEPIVLLLSIYMAIIYGTLYMFFGAFPIVYQEYRGWNQGVGGLAFIGILIGQFVGIAYTIPENHKYVRLEKENGGFTPPEARLPPGIVGAFALPIGLFWFSWTNSPSIHWMASITAGVPFGFGMVLVFLSAVNYLVDAYTIFAASVLAANSILRSCFGAVFPLFTKYMYDDLGIHWASSIAAFLALACLPFPILFYRYGPAIRARCKYAAESAAFLKRLQEGQVETGGSSERSAEGILEKEEGDNQPGQDDTENENENSGSDEVTAAALARVRTATSSLARVSTGRRSYEGNPYDLDLVNTRQSFGG